MSLYTYDAEPGDLVIKYPDLYASRELADAAVTIFSAIKDNNEWNSLQGMDREIALSPDSEMGDIKCSKTDALSADENFIAISSRWGSEFGMLITTEDKVTPFIRDMMDSGTVFKYKWGREDSQNAAVMLVIYAIDKRVPGWDTISTNGTISELISALRLYEMTFGNMSDETFAKVMGLFSHPLEDFSACDPEEYDEIGESDMIARAAFDGFTEEDLLKLAKGEFYSRVSRAMLERKAFTLAALVAHNLNYTNCAIVRDAPVEDLLFALGGEATRSWKPTSDAATTARIRRPLEILEELWRRSGFGAVTDTYNFHGDEYGYCVSKNRDNGIWARKGVRKAKDVKEIIDAIASKREAYGYDNMLAALMDGIPEQDVFA